MRLLHTMLRVGNLQRSIDFYTGVLGMTLLRTTERPEQKYDLAFVGYGSEAALSRAFKRWVGVAPAPYRRGELNSVAR